MIQSDKLRFVCSTAPEMLLQLKLETQAAWGKMNAIQLIEHLTDFFYVSANKLVFELVTPEEQLHLFKAFLLSEKPFRENTKAPESVIPTIPAPAKFQTIAEAMQQLNLSVNAFQDFFAEDTEKKTLHPVFGWLNYEEWILLHSKHLQHHLKQFGLIN